MKIAAILFDFDGTLVHSPIDFGVMKAGVRELIHTHAKSGTDELRASDVLGLVREGAALVDAARGAEARAAFETAAEAVILEEELRAAKLATPAPGAHELMATLAERGTRIGVCTRNARAIVLPLATKFGLAHDVLVAREDTPRPKPAPVHLRKALVHLRCSPRAAAFVGDHAMDALGARRAGMKSFGVPGTHPPSAEAIARAFLAHPPDVMLPSLLDLLAHLG